MLILSSSWGGKAEHGILRIEANSEDNKLIITARDSYYNDYNPTGVPEKENVCSSEIMIDDIKVDSCFLFEHINNLLKKNHISGYRFDINDIKQL